MAFVDWEDRYRLGVPTMDEDHRRLAQLLDDVMAATGDEAEMARRLHILVDETRAHFQREETLLDRNNYPDLAAHKAEHDVLLGQMRSFEERFAAGLVDRSVMAEIGDFLRHWLIDHVQRGDRAYAPFLMRLA